MIEQLLREHLQEKGNSLQPFLARYKNQMAIFSLNVPDEGDSGWEGTEHYARIVFTVQSERSWERNSRGSLILDVICKQRRQNPEEIEPLAKPLIDGWFFNLEQEVLSANWVASSYDTAPDNNLCKVRMVFDLYAYPKQVTIGPDPVARINKWTKEELAQVLRQNLYVIGLDNLPTSFKPSAEYPAIYWRVIKTRKCDWIPETQACSWQTAELRGHILTADTPDTATFIARVIDNTLTVKRRLLFDDKSPLFVDRNIRIERNVRLQKTGQITVDATYGVQSRQENVEKLKKIVYRER